MATKADALRMIRKSVKQVLVIASIAIAAVSGLAGNFSFFCHVDLQWRKNGLYHQFRIEDGKLLWIRLSRCQLPEDGKIWYEIEWQKGSLLHRIRQWRSDEPIDFTVQRKHWIPGFEYAEGDFWPPLFWRHPRMPFQRIRISLAAVFVLGAVYPIYWLAQRVRRGVPPDITQSAEAPTEGLLFGELRTGDTCVPTNTERLQSLCLRMLATIRRIASRQVEGNVRIPDDFGDLTLALICSKSATATKTHGYESTSGIFEGGHAPPLFWPGWRGSRRRCAGELATA